jgi:TonB family protein
MFTGKSQQLALFLAVACFFAAGAAIAQTAYGQAAVTAETGRKVKSKVNPIYPELARRMNITGKVKIEVVITPDGHVKSTRVVGGHPILVQACQDAVKDWKFMPATEETLQVIEFDFHEQQ